MNEQSLVKVEISDEIIDQIIDAEIVGTKAGGQLTSDQALRAIQRELRRANDLQHQRKSDAVGRLCFGVGVVCVFGVVLMALFVGIVKMLTPAPPPPPVVNPNCWIGCRSEVPNAVRR